MSPSLRDQGWSDIGELTDKPLSQRLIDRSELVLTSGTAAPGIGGGVDFGAAGRTLAGT